MQKVRVPTRYISKSLSKKDKLKQRNMLQKSKKLYKKNKFYTRKRLSSYKNKPSNHITNARNMYKILKTQAHL